MPSIAEFNRYLSIPVEPNRCLTPNQYFEYTVPKGKKVVITDIYVENLGGGGASLEICEQRLPNSFDVRYVFNVKAGQTLSLNLSTGLRLGETAAIKDKVRVQNSYNSQANLWLRINGQLVG